MCSNSSTTPAAVGDPVTFCLPREIFISASFQLLCVVYLQCGLELPWDDKMLYSREHSAEHRWRQHPQLLMDGVGTWRFSEEAAASTRLKVLMGVTVQSRLCWGHLGSVCCPLVCTRSSSCRSNRPWGTVEWMFVSGLLCLPPPWNLASSRGRAEFFASRQQSALLR